eukprot:TRINITY_DN32980_c0_g1_i4.p1 TRINITY_DN32980_c0_g1~~TRINITY_DN32980_c0_g1_i4.p1  ORF type:complete len:104 (+),score=17.09 TRINITY_DN32980_c0_g1_i4:102-413(+)
MAAARHTPLQGHGGNVRSVAFSPSGQQVVTGSYDKTAIVWQVSQEDPSKWQQLATLQGHGSPHSKAIARVAISVHLAADMNNFNNYDLANRICWSHLLDNAFA